MNIFHDRGTAKLINSMSRASIRLRISGDKTVYRYSRRKMDRTYRIIPRFRELSKKRNSTMQAIGLHLHNQSHNRNTTVLSCPGRFSPQVQSSADGAPWHTKDKWQQIRLTCADWPGHPFQIAKAPH